MQAEYYIILMTLHRVLAFRRPASTVSVLIMGCLVGCLVAPSSANLLCSGSDPTCQTYLPEAAFYAQSNASNFVYDFFSENATTVPNFPGKPDDMRGTLFTPTEMPMVQLSSVDIHMTYTWIPNGSVSMPHYHSNAVEWGFITKGSGYACVTERRTCVNNLYVKYTWHVYNLMFSLAMVAAW